VSGVAVMVKGPLGGDEIAIRRSRVHCSAGDGSRSSFNPFVLSLSKEQNPVSKSCLRAGGGERSPAGGTEPCAQLRIMRLADKDVPPELRLGLAGGGGGGGLTRDGNEADLALADEAKLFASRGLDVLVGV